VPRPNDLTDQWPGRGSLTGESVAPALLAWAGRAAAMSRGLNSPVGRSARHCPRRLRRSACGEVLAAKRGQRPDQSDSRLPESEHAMLKINIPQHSRGLMIAAERAGSRLKANRFQSDRVEARIVQACPARLSGTITLQRHGLSHRFGVAGGGGLVHHICNEIVDEACYRRPRLRFYAQQIVNAARPSSGGGATLAGAGTFLAKLARHVRARFPFRVEKMHQT
jgi:hypothetical protein